jgi:signal transduction histidine kinase
MIYAVVALLSAVIAITTAIAIWLRFREPSSARLLRAVYHSFVATTAVLLPISGALMWTGVELVRLVNVEDSRVVAKSSAYPWSFGFAPAIPAIAAFLLRDTRSIIGYSCLTSATIVVATAATVPPASWYTSFVQSVTTLLAVVLVAYTTSSFALTTVDLSQEAVASRNRLEQVEDEVIAERRANEAKTRFVGVMSHEIRNPLQAILLQLEMLEVTKLSPSQTNYVAGITRASHVMLRIVNDVLDVSKIEAGAVALDDVEFSLAEVVEQTLAANVSAGASKPVDLLLNMDPALHPWVFGDPTRIRQVVHNFLSNALKFTEAGEIEITVTLENDQLEVVPPPGADEDGEEEEGGGGGGGRVGTQVCASGTLVFDSCGRSL